MTPESEVEKILLNQVWHRQCEVVEGYLPPYPTAGTRPKTVVRYINNSGQTSYLRYSQGPLADPLWDVYGDDFQTRALAVVALSRAPSPPWQWPGQQSDPLAEFVQLVRDYFGARDNPLHAGSVARAAELEGAIRKRVAL